MTRLTGDAVLELAEPPDIMSTPAGLLFLSLGTALEPEVGSGVTIPVVVISGEWMDDCGDIIVLRRVGGVSFVTPSNERARLISVGTNDTLICGVCAVFRLKSAIAASYPS